MMYKKLVFLIALVLALAQGVAAATEGFSATVGQQVNRTLTFSFNPNAVVMMPKTGNELSLQGLDVVSTLGYSVTVVGTDQQMFTASILSANISMTTNYVTMSVDVVYSPTVEGTHQATLRVIDQSSEIKHTISLVGEATPLPEATVEVGDVDGDGRVTVADVTELIDHLLGNQSNNFIVDNADVDGDGRITVADITELIDIILGVPKTRLTTFLIVTMTDGATKEFMIDEYSTVKIAKPNLFIQNNTETQVYDLELVAHLSYDERMVTFSNKLANDYLIEQYREIIKSLKP